MNISVKLALEPGVLINKMKGTRKFQEVKLVENNNAMMLDSLNIVFTSEMAVTLFGQEWLHQSMATSLH